MSGRRTCTGSGLPPGPGGAYGAAEGVSYLVVVGIVAWSIYAKVRHVVCCVHDWSYTPVMLHGAEGLCKCHTWYKQCECALQVKTGSGLPSGPGGLLGAAEGLSFLGVTSGLIIAALQAVNPSPL